MQVLLFVRYTQLFVYTIDMVFSPDRSLKFSFGKSETLVDLYLYIYICKSSLALQTFLHVHRTLIPN